MQSVIKYAKYAKYSKCGKACKYVQNNSKVF